MVFLRSITPALCELMDAAVQSRSFANSPHVDAFIEERLRSLVHTQTPSQLDNALWIFLISQEQLINTRTNDKEEEVNKKNVAVSSASLPPPLQLPPSITTVQDAVRWYCGELQVPVESPSPSPPASNGAASVQKKSNSDKDEVAADSSKPPRRGLLFSDARLHQHDAARQASARLDELLRHRHQPTPTSSTTTTTGMTGTASHPIPTTSADAETNSSKEKVSTAPETGPLATIRLALAALVNTRRAAALRQPRSLVLLVRDLASLWSLVYLCRQLRRHQLRKEQLLIGGGSEASGGVSASTATTAATTATGAPSRLQTEAPLSVCFHDYDLLVPWDLVCSTLRSGDDAHGGDESAERVHEGNAAAPLTMAAVAAQCRRQNDVHAVSLEKQRGTAAVTGTSSAASLPPISLVINPAVTRIEDNPDRLRKNARIDAIDEAANKYYYTLLATRAHGQAGSITHVGANAANSTAATAAAAAHQEAVRNSLAKVDLGDYGVLDPSRMRAGELAGLSSASSQRSGFQHTAATLGGSGMTKEESAKSYALFLRDASIGFDIQIMALTGAGVGYYMGYLRGLPTEWCTLYAVVGLVTMLLVDALLIMIRMGRQDEAVRRARKRIRRQREKLDREGEKLVAAMQQAAAGSEAADRKASSTNVAVTDARAAEAGEEVTTEKAEDALEKKKQ